MTRLTPWLFLALAGPLWADSITTTGGFTFDGVQIERIDGGQLYYHFQGDLKTKDVADIATMTLDDETDFNAAESAYQQKHWDTATDGYMHELSATDKEWLKDWIAPRLLDAANQAGRFDVAVSAWTRIVAQDASLGAKLRPALPKDQDSSLGTAANELNDAAQSAKGPSRRLMLGLLLDVDTARQDTDAANAVAKQLQQGETDTAPAASDMNTAEQDTRIALARAALNDGKYDQAIAAIDAAAGLLTDPGKQSDALFMRAQALEAKAAAAGKSDDWKDAALAYMRVYVHFRDADGRAAEALMKTAQIEETDLHEPSAALTLYQKVAGEYKDTLEARQATQEAARLAGK
jgi:hypothetical protein